MWASWLTQPGQSLTSRPEQNFAHREVTNCVKPKERRIVGHNESEGIMYGTPKSKTVALGQDIYELEARIAARVNR
jgi:hypothetical protein